MGNHGQQQIAKPPDEVDGEYNMPYLKGQRDIFLDLRVFALIRPNEVSQSREVLILFQGDEVMLT